MLNEPNPRIEFVAEAARNTFISMTPGYGCMAENFLDSKLAWTLRLLADRHTRLGISIWCGAHELKPILMRRANSQYTSINIVF